MAHVNPSTSFITDINTLRIGCAEKLDLSLNSLEFSSLPSEFGDLTSLVDIDLSGNAFSGALPTEFGLLTLLGEFGLYGTVSNIELRAN
jgi:hypothetical protein